MASLSEKPCIENFFWIFFLDFLDFLDFLEYCVKARQTFLAFNTIYMDAM